jgi:hypothetical protein
MLTQLPAAQRLLIVQNIGDTSQGDSLAGQNVGLYPAGVLAYVVDSNRFYRLKKNLPTAVIADTGLWRNVVAGVGSSSEDGMWVAVEQVAEFTLSGSGTAAVNGFALTVSEGAFLISLVTPGGTTGFVHGVASTAAQATFASTQAADTGTYVAVYIESASAF